jgi:hypothetical protein
MKVKINNMELVLIRKSILEISGRKVILDYELAKIDEVETRVLKQAVRRNIERFPADLMFELTHEEFENLTSQFVTSGVVNVTYRSHSRNKVLPCFQRIKKEIQIQ